MACELTVRLSGEKTTMTQSLGICDERNCSFLIVMPSWTREGAAAGSWSWSKPRKRDEVVSLILLALVVGVGVQLWSVAEGGPTQVAGWSAGRLPLPGGCFVAYLALCCANQHTWGPPA